MKRQQTLNEEKGKHISDLEAFFISSKKTYYRQNRRKPKGRNNTCKRE